MEGDNNNNEKKPKKRQLSKSEREAIADYKTYQVKYFPPSQYKKIADYWAVNFNESNHFVSSDADMETRLNALNVYLDEMQEYSKRLSRAAFLRNLHYEQFLAMEQFEDEGHEHFRKAMLAVAKDARDKITFWKQQRDAILDDIFDQNAWNTKRSSPIQYIADIRDVDTYDDVEISKSQIKAVRKPKMSNAERKRRKRQRQKLRDKVNKEALDHVMSEMALEEKREQNLLQNPKFREKFFLSISSLTHFIKILDPFYFKKKYHGNQYRGYFINIDKSIITSQKDVENLYKIFVQKLANYFTNHYNLHDLLHIVFYFGYDTIDIFQQKDVIDMIEFASQIIKDPRFIILFIRIAVLHFKNYSKYKKMIQNVHLDHIKSKKTFFLDIQWLPSRYNVLTMLLFYWDGFLNNTEEQGSCDEYEFLEAYIQKHSLFKNIFKDPLVDNLSVDERKLVYQMIDLRKASKEYHKWRLFLLEHFPLYQQIKTAIVPFCLHCLKDANKVDSEYRWTFCDAACQNHFYDSLTREKRYEVKSEICLK